MKKNERLSSICKLLTLLLENESDYLELCGAVLLFYSGFGIFNFKEDYKNQALVEIVTILDD